MIELILLSPLLLVELLIAVVGTYLAVLAVASFLYRTPRRPATVGKHVFAIVIPAHNEETVIARLLRSLQAIEYPAEQYEVFVVADNCNDGTEFIARSMGVAVHARHEPDAAGKGQALRWLLAQIPLQAFDAVIIVDADTVVSPNILTAANAALANGHPLCQIYDGVLNGSDSPSAGLRALAFDLHNRVRPMGKEVLGASVGLMGNGMIISTVLLGDGLWEGFGLAEDIEFHAKLLERGERVHFVPEAASLAEMPTSLSSATGQNVRWEAGRIAAARRFAPRLALSGLRRLDRVRLFAALDLIVPPQSVQFMVVATGVVAAIAVQQPVTIALATWLVLTQAVYLVGGLLQLWRHGASLRCLVHAPGYILWKCALYARVVTGGGSRAWVRGPRREAS